MRIAAEAAVCGLQAKLLDRDAQLAALSQQMSGQQAAFMAQQQDDREQPVTACMLESRAASHGVVQIAGNRATASAFTIIDDPLKDQVCSSLQAVFVPT
jgi:hypothetical protein